jgi:CheY-like chemotaxis protein
MKHTALVVEDDPQSLDLIEDVLVVLDHKHDVAATLLEARRLVGANEYSYILLDIEFPARSPRGIPRIQNAESFLEDLAAGHGEDAPPVIIMNDRAASGLDLTEDMMRLAMSLSRKGAIDLIKKPFPTAGRTLDRVIKKVLGKMPIRIPARGRVKRKAIDEHTADGGRGDAPDLRGDAPSVPETLTVTEAAKLLMAVVSNIDLKKARARISKAADAGKFKTNGQKGRSRRIDQDSFNTWRFEQMEKDLAAADW